MGVSRASAVLAVLPRSLGIGVAICAVIALVFLADVSTPADDVSVSFAYLIPISASLFETRPRSLLYALVTSILSVCALIVLPPNYATTLVMVAISITTQWIIALLVRLHGKRMAEAQEKAESQRRFVDILSHEIGTALTAVSGQSYRLIKLAGQLTPEEVRLRAEKIQKAAERIQAIVNRIQFAASLGDGSIPGGVGTVDIQLVLEQLTDQVRDEHPGRILSLKLSPGPKLVTGDEMLLRQAFENIITNAIKYAPAAEPLSITVTDQQVSVQVTVTDQGPGLSAEELERVRGPYYRGENSKSVSGAGLGLYVVGKIVEAHQGELFLESKVGAGTQVTVELPLVETGASA